MTYTDTYLDTYGSIMTRSMFDAAWPPTAPPKVSIVNRYIGPVGGTPHVWTQAETDTQVAKSGARYVLPNFVRVPPTTHDPKDDAAFVVGWLRAHDVPKGVTHALDYETAVDATYLRAYDAVIVAAGYRTMVYGSRSFVLQNPKPSGGYWTAHWNNTPHICSDAGVVATQYGGDTTLGQPWDINLVADSVPLWDVTGQETDMSYENWTQAGKDAFWADLKRKLTGENYPEPVFGHRFDDGALTATELLGKYGAPSLAHSQLAQGIALAVQATGIPATLTQSDREAIAALVVAQLQVDGEATISGTLAITPKPSA